MEGGKPLEDICRNNITDWKKQGKSKQKRQNLIIAFLTDQFVNCLSLPAIPHSEYPKFYFKEDYLQNPDAFQEGIVETFGQYDILYHNESNAIYMDDEFEFTFADLMEECVHFVNFHLNGMKCKPLKWKNILDDFYKRAMAEAIAYAGVELVMPGRKRLLLDEDITPDILPLYRGHVHFQEAETVDEELQKEGESLIIEILKLDLESFTELSHLLGYHHGHKIYESIQAEKFSIEEYKKLLYENFVDGKPPHEVYFDLAEELA